MRIIKNQFNGGKDNTLKHGFNLYFKVIWYSKIYRQSTLINTVKPLYLKKY